ncbi:translocation/assembly module TamB domain-containing protein [Flavobacterium sp. 20NA77.7]|uniref:Translocation/assembly module TamB domain-containing protein n=1 Tax=Flavobacterium nakdongensis TaxID=3073563 RepID=A0ABY9REZ3_9FLAO|nr:translocation/assembly module TamB domain-containing protein [Flavobacterium sp. 20NA77.7]WMW78716.1 translocation/assembly module TamB domain-containing protein [Flavobacterium sp. 20NA77.7]
MLLVTAAILLSLPVVQTKLGSYATNALKEDFGVNITIKRVAITPFGGVKLNDIQITDHRQDTLAHIDRLQTSILSFSKLYNSGHPYFGDLRLDGLNFKIIQYKGERDTNLDRFVAAFDDGKPSSGKFRLKANSIYLKTSRFRYIDANLKDTRVVDFKNLNGQLDDFFVKGANVTAYAYKLSFKDHRGIEVKNLTTDFTYTKKNILLNELELVTAHSSFKGRTELLYNRKDFSDFNNKVIFDLQIHEGKISSNDLNCFYPEFGKNQLFFIDSHVIGTLNNLAFHNLKVMDFNGNEIVGEIKLVNSFGKSHQKFSLNGKFDRLSTSRQGLAKVMPSLLGKKLPENFKNFGNILLSGEFFLTKKQVIADITLLSKVGQATADFTLNGLDVIDQATYKGEFTLNQFNLGVLFATPTFGLASLHAKIDGRGFTKKYLNTTFTGNAQKFTFNGYAYSNIELDGLFKMPYFKGDISCNDPNLKMIFNGLIDLSKTKKEYDFTTQIAYANLKKINWYKKDELSEFSGEISVKAKGNSLDDLIGQASINNITYKNSKSTYYFDEATLFSTFDSNNVRTVSLVSSDMINGQVVGKYKVQEINKIVENAVGSLYANYSPHKLQKNQYLDFDITIHSKIVELFFPDIHVAENTFVKGKINATDGLFKFDFKSPLIDVYGTKFNKISVAINNKNPLYNTYITLDSINSEMYKISDFNLINVTMNDTLFLRSEFKGGPKGEDRFDINVFHTIDKNKNSVVGFKKSDITFKKSQWYINENDTDDNAIIFDKKFQNFEFNKLTLSHNNQFIDFSGVMKDSTYKDLSLNFKDVDIAKITPELENLSFGGQVNGKITYKQIKTLFEPTTDLRVKDLVINNTPLGNLDVKVSGDESLRKFNVNANLNYQDSETFFTTGIVEFVNKKPILSLDAGFRNLNIAPLGGFLKGILENVRGEASGSANIVGSLENPDINGAIYLNKAGLKVPYLNVDYDFEKNAIIGITEDKFLFKNINLIDVAEKTRGVLSGTISHKKLEDWDMDLKINSDRLLVLDTKDSEDAYYFGKAFFNGYGTIEGPVNALVIEANGSSAKGTSLKIPVNESETIGDNSYVHFVTREEKFGTKKAKKETKTYKGIDLNFNFDITTDAEIEVILNRETGHAMKGKGLGSLNMNINTLGKFNMVGDFQVIEGKYLFRYGNLFDKNFSVKKGGTIRWDGDPMSAILDLEAVYTTQANPGVLIESASVNKKIPTEVVIAITGDLSNPQSDFTINFPTVQSSLKSEIDYRLQDKDFRQRQAFGLLATGSFVAATNTSWYGSFLETAKGLFGEVLSDGENKLQFGVDYQVGDKQRAISDRALVTLNTQINDKLSINGNVGVPVGGVNQSYVVGNVEVELKLNEDGSLTAHVFNKENDINYLATGQNTGYTQGIGLSYSVDFDDFKSLLHELFRSQKKNKKTTNKSEDHLPDSEISPDMINFIEETRKRQINEEKKKTPPQIVPEID